MCIHVCVEYIIYDMCCVPSSVVCEKLNMCIIVCAHMCCYVYMYVYVLCILMCL